jgi:hypothetical protein
VLQDSGESEAKVLPREITGILRKQQALLKEPVCTREGRCIFFVGFNESDRANVLCCEGEGTGFKSTPRISCRFKKTE